MFIAKGKLNDILDTYVGRWPIEYFSMKANVNLHWINTKSEPVQEHKGICSFIGMNTLQLVENL